jgi:2-oxoisovalerate dehydrogenase E1 component
MPRSIALEPAALRQPGVLVTKDIPLNSYRRPFEQELTEYGDERLVALLRDMIAIRTFEDMLYHVKTVGAWNGVEYKHQGPAHMSTGQEAYAVGQSAALDVDDLVFGSHRSHHEVLAKCFSAARQMDAGRLQGIMEHFLDGRTLKLAEQVPHDGLFGLAENFTLAGMMAEIFARTAGFNQGLGGSMHAFFAPFGSMPNNAIVGGSAPIANGAALYKRINRQPGIVVANIGDGSLGCGPVWEAMTMAAMEQFHTLWRAEDGGHPPILFSIVNNFYAMGGQTLGETMGFEIAARVGAGVNPEAMHSERVDGYDPLAVADAVRRQKQLLVDGKGPALLDVITYRFAGHSTSDASTYRTHEELAEWEKQDSITAFSGRLTEAGVLTQHQVDLMAEDLRSKVTGLLRIVIDPLAYPRATGEFVESVMLSNGSARRLGTGEPELAQPLAENSRMKAIGMKTRSVIDASGKPVSRSKLYQFRDGVFEAIANAFATDPSLAAWGEENRDWGGSFGVYRGLTELLPYRRLFNTSISEAAIVGAGVGYALSGGRALVELMYCDFLGRAGDEVFNQAAKWQSMSAGELRMPLVIRASVGSKYGAQHSQDWTALVAHIPGLKVYFPATPTDAKGMMALALSGTDPVVFLESQLLYDIGEQFEPGGVPIGYYETAEGEPATRREGSDITIATMGATLYRALLAADEMQQRYGLSAEVIDLRFAVPLNYEKLIASVRKTGRLLLSSDEVERGSFMHTVASKMQSYAFDYLDAPVTVVGSRNHIPCAPELEHLFYPQPDWLIDAIHTQILPIPGYQPSSSFSSSVLQSRDQKGV